MGTDGRQDTPATAAPRGDADATQAAPARVDQGAMESPRGTTWRRSPKANKANDAQAPPKRRSCRIYARKERCCSCIKGRICAPLSSSKDPCECRREGRDCTCCRPAGMCTNRPQTDNRPARKSTKTQPAEDRPFEEEGANPFFMPLPEDKETNTQAMTASQDALTPPTVADRTNGHSNSLTTDRAPAATADRPAGRTLPADGHNLAEAGSEHDPAHNNLPASHSEPSRRNSTRSPAATPTGTYGTTTPSPRGRKQPPPRTATATTNSTGDNDGTTMVDDGPAPDDDAYDSDGSNYSTEPSVTQAGDRNSNSSCRQHAQTNHATANANATTQSPSRDNIATATDSNHQLADLEGYQPSLADQKLDEAYGDHHHQNSGSHLHGGINDDAVWQLRHKRIISARPSRYQVPSGRAGRRFISMLTKEFQGVRERKWNSERPIIFAAVVLQRTPTVRAAKDVRARLEKRMDYWAEGSYDGLISDTIAESHPGGAPPASDESKARAYNNKVNSGRLRQAVRTLTSRDGGPVLQPSDRCTKTNRPVIDVLRDKHPPLRMPDGQSELFTGDDLPDVIDIDITEDTVEKVASQLSGAAGPGGTDAVDLRNWLLRFNEESKELRKEMAAWTNWLANHSPPWAAYRALMASRLIALDKQPGIRPIGIGEIYRRLFAKCVLKGCGTAATAACNNLNLSAGLSAGIEGAAHTMSYLANTIVAEDNSQDQHPNPDLEESTTPHHPNNNCSPEKDQAMVLVDARNGFNEINRIALLWTVRHLWPQGSRFAFNCYRHAANLFVRQPKGLCETILSQEGITQGDPSPWYYMALQSHHWPPNSRQHTHRSPKPGMLTTLHLQAQQQSSN